jgi:hypothetical protein
MDVSAVFLPVGVELIDNTFPTDIVYHQHDTTGTYDPLTGTVTGADTDHAIKAGVLSRSRVEAGGPNETYEILLWVHHGATGLSFLPTTADSFTYDAVVWKVVSVEPTYSSKSLIASKIKGRAS